MFWSKLRLLAVLFGANIAYSLEFCISQTPCKCDLSPSSVIDLSSVGVHDHQRFQDVSFEDTCNTTELYNYNPCFPFDLSDKDVIVKPGQKPCVGAAACIKHPGGSGGEPPEVHAIGLQSTGIFGSNGTHTYINYTVPDAENILMVILICNESITGHVLSMIEPECTGKKTVLQLFSKCACSNGCPSSSPVSSSGMSTGSKLLIAFFTIVLTYFIVGIVWNFCNGAHGIELLPNFEFWNDLPTLIMEGVIFTCSCFSRKSSYGEV